MYKIYVDNQLLCDSKVEELAIIDPVVKLAANSAGSFTFTIPCNHPYKDIIKRRLSIISVYIDSDNTPTFQGIVVEETTDFYGQTEYECEGELTYFNDTIQRQAHYSGLTVRQLLETYINIHNSQVEESKRFTLGQVTVEDDNDYITCFTNYNSTMTEIKEDLVDDLGGYIRIRYDGDVKYIDYLADSPRTNAQVIKLGENLLDYSSNIDDTEIATSILPLGATLETQAVESLDAYTTIVSAAADTYHPEGADYVYSKDAVKNYGWIQKIVNWDDVSIPSNLLKKAEAYLTDIQFENVVLTISALDLAYLNSDTSHFKILDKIRVVSEFHGMDRYFILTEQTLNLNNPEKDTITLGKTQKLSLTAATSSQNEQILKRIEQMPTSNAVRSAIENATALITGAEGGYVVIETNDKGQPIEIKIQDALESPTKIWRWNVNGLGYSKDGGKTYGLAMTMDGSIVADYITTGTMTADRVRGGTFEIGGTSLGKDGKILVKNASGTTLITIDKNGITFSGGEKISSSDISNDDGWINSTQATNITKNTVTTAYVNALNVTAKYIQANLVTAGASRIGKFYIGENYLESHNGDGSSDKATRIAAMYPYLGDEVKNAAFYVGVRGSTSEGWTEKFSVRYNGDVNAVVAHLTYCYYTYLWENSDERLKEDIKDLSEITALYILKNLRPVTFKFKKYDTKRAGFIAQEVEKIVGDDREIFITDMPDGYLGVDYTTFVPYLVKGYQSQQNEIDSLKEEIEFLKQEIKTMKGEN